LPSGENLGQDSSPGLFVKGSANPPSLGMIQISPPYTKVICVAETSIYRISLALIWASVPMEAVKNKTRNIHLFCMIVGVWVTLQDRKKGEIGVEFF
jgi:hypothetical protein